MQAVKKALKKIVKPVYVNVGKPARAVPQNTSGIPSWHTEPNDLPWFDRPEALKVLDQKRTAHEISDLEHTLLKKWVVDGYIILEDSVDIKDVDQMISTLDNLWTAKKPLKGLTLLGLKKSEEGPFENLSHEQILELDSDLRTKMPTLSNWRIHEFHLQSQNAKNLFQSQKIEKMCDLIFGRRANARSTINFMYGSGQELHQDMAVFHIYPHNYLIGAWLACEDIHPESGPLVYYPGSHRIPFYPGFTDYPQTQLRTLPADECKLYHDYLHAQMAKFERKEFIAKKGQVFLWHGGLVHGGAPIKTPNLTRKSFVIHYLTDGVDRTEEIKGPYNWQ